MMPVLTLVPMKTIIPKICAALLPPFFTRMDKGIAYSLYMYVCKDQHIFHLDIAPWKELYSSAHKVIGSLSGGPVVNIRTDEGICPHHQAGGQCDSRRCAGRYKRVWGWLNEDGKSQHYKSSYRENKASVPQSNTMTSRHGHMAHNQLYHYRHYWLDLLGRSIKLDTPWSVTAVWVTPSCNQQVHEFSNYRQHNSQVFLWWVHTPIIGPLDPQFPTTSNQSQNFSLYSSSSNELLDNHFHEHQRNFAWRRGGVNNNRGGASGHRQDPKFIQRESGDH